MADDRWHWSGKDDCTSPAPAAWIPRLAQSASYDLQSALVSQPLVESLRDRSQEAMGPAETSGTATRPVRRRASHRLAKLEAGLAD